MLQTFRCEDFILLYPLYIHHSVGLRINFVEGLLMFGKDGGLK